MATKKTPGKIAEELAAQAEEARIQREAAAKSLSLYNDDLQKQLEILKEISNLEKQEENLRKKSISYFQTSQNLTKQQQKTLSEQTSILKQQNTNYNAINQNIKTAVDAAKQKTDQEELQEEILKRQKELNKDISDALQNQVTQLFGINDSGSTIAGKFLKSKLEIIDMQKGLKEASFSTKVLVSAVDSLVQNTVELAKKQDAALTTLNRSIGAYGQYEKAIIEVSRANVSFGISTEDAAFATESLFKNINTFNTLSKNTTKELIETTSQLEKLGIGSDLTAKNMMTLTKATGMSLDGARKLQIQFAALASDIGLPPKELAEEFSSAAPKLAMYGADMTKVFVGLAKASKETGISINSLIGITGKFDTFEGAADAAGKLNAILGGDLLNSTELMLASDEERIKMLQDSIVMSGKSWESMDRFQKKAIATAAGISDMDEATKIFNPSQNKMRTGLMDAEEAATKLQERATDVQELTVRWDNLMKAFSLTLRPVIVYLNQFVGWLAEMVDGLNKSNPNLMAFIGIVAIAVPALIKMGSAIATLIKIKQAYSAASGLAAKIVAVFGGQAEQSGNATGRGALRAAMGIRAIGRAATQNALGLAVLSLVILSIGASIGLAAFGMAKLVASFAKLSGEQVTGAIKALGIFSVTIVALVGALALLASSSAIGWVGVAILGAVGVAMLAIGYGVKMAAEGIASAISNITNLVNVMKDMPSGKLSELKDALEELKDFDFSDLAKNMATPFTQTVQAIKEATGEMTKFKSEYASLAPSPTVPNTAAMSNAMSSTSQVVMYTRAIETIKNQAIPAAATNTTQPQNSQPVKLILKIDSKEFAEATWQAYRDVTELKMKAR